MLLSSVKYCVLASSILKIHDPEACGHTDARTILGRLMQSFQQLTISKMHQHSDSFTVSLGEMFFVTLPGLDCSHLSCWLGCSKHLAPTHMLKAVGKMSVLKIQVISFGNTRNIYAGTLLFLAAGVASTKKKG